MKKLRLWLLRYLLKGTGMILVVEQDQLFAMTQLRGIDKYIANTSHFSNSRSNRVSRIGKEIRAMVREVCIVLTPRTYAP